MIIEQARQHFRNLAPHIRERETARILAAVTEEAERMREALRRWMPIETAPRGSGEDGPGDMTHPDYVQPPNVLLWTQEGPVVGHYDWYYHDGYGGGAEPGVSAWRDRSGDQTYGATHWMPLPDAPDV